VIGYWILTCPPKTDPGRKRGSVEKEAINAIRKKIHTGTHHHRVLCVWRSFVVDIDQYPCSNFLHL
jgi:hypothetical protein